MNTSPTAIVLFAHGSRDPLWRLPIDAVATQMQSLSPATTVRCAFLELTDPDLGSTVDALVQMGHTAIRIVPMFLGVGRHAREDLPQLVAELQQRHPGLGLTLQMPIGEEPEMTLCMARIALQNHSPVKT
jgi:sirohydrochlorin cobaltochelatase